MWNTVCYLRSKTRVTFILPGDSVPDSVEVLTSCFCFQFLFFFPPVVPGIHLLASPSSWLQWQCLLSACIPQQALFLVCVHTFILSISFLHNKQMQLVSPHTPFLVSGKIHMYIQSIVNIQFLSQYTQERVGGDCYACLPRIDLDQCPSAGIKRWKALF